MLASVVVLMVWLGAFKRPSLEASGTSQLPHKRVVGGGNGVRDGFTVMGHGGKLDRNPPANPSDVLQEKAPAPALQPAAQAMGVVEAGQEGHVGMSVDKWKSMFDVLRAVNSTQALQYFVLRNWENLPGSAIRGEHHDIDLYVSSRDAFAELVGCTYTGKTNQQCWVQPMDGGSAIHFDVHGPDDAAEYYPAQWGSDMLSTRELSRPSAEASQGHGGVWKANDVHYFYSLLYHLSYHGKTAVKDDYVPVLDALRRKVGATLPRQLQDIPEIKDAVDRFLRCKGYTPIKATFKRDGPFSTNHADCVQ